MREFALADEELGSCSGTRLVAFITSTPRLWSSGEASVWLELGRWRDEEWEKCRERRNEEARQGGGGCWCSPCGGRHHAFVLTESGKWNVWSIGDFSAFVRRFGRQVSVTCLIINQTIFPNYSYFLDLLIALIDISRKYRLSFFPFLSLKLKFKVCQRFLLKIQFFVLEQVK